jgi:hypothetical protein
MVSPRPRHRVHARRQRTFSEAVKDQGMMQ